MKKNSGECSGPPMKSDETSFSVKCMRFFDKKFTFCDSQLFSLLLKGLKIFLYNRGNH